jgi:outer membrane protein TolC
LPATPTSRDSLPELDADASLADYRLHAALNNPGLEALYLDWQAALQRIPQARALPEPRFSYSEFLVEVETRVGPQERKFGLKQNFPWFGTLSLRGEIEEETARVAWQNLLAAQLALDFQVRQNHADFYYLARSVVVTGENIQLLRRLESVARQKLAVGEDNHPDLIRLQIEIGRLEDRLKTLEDQQRPLSARLNALLGRLASTLIPWPEALEAAGEFPSDEELFQFVEQNNPELVSLQHRMRRSELGKKLAGKAYYPDFSLGVETVETGSAVAPNTRGSGDDPWMVTFSVEVPIWYSSYRASEREADARWRSAQRRHLDTRNRLRSDLELALYNRRDALRRVSLHQNTLIPKSEQSIRATEAAYRAGRSDFFSLIDAQRVLLKFQLAVERANADRFKSDASIDRLVGRFIIDYPRPREELVP